MIVIVIIFIITDNPLICDCELRWYKVWLRNLKDKDDEMMQKKRTICTMENEHREYAVQSVPFEKMNCIWKNMGQSSLASRLQTSLIAPLAYYVILILFRNIELFCV